MTDHIRPSGKSNMMNIVLAELPPGGEIVGRGRIGRNPAGFTPHEQWWLISGRKPPTIPAGIDYAATNAAEAAKMLDKVRQIIELRAQARQATDDGGHLDEVPLVLCIDEAADLLTAPGAPNVSDVLRDILHHGRAVQVRTAFRSADDRRLMQQYASVEELEAASEGEA